MADTERPSEPERLALRVVERIKAEHLVPRSRYGFLLRNAAFWGAGAVSVALGALATAAALFEIAHAGWPLYEVTHGDIASFVVASAPYLWILALALFVGLGYLNIRHTRRGYRYPLSVVALGAVLTSLALGNALYALGAGGPIEGFIGDHPPFYRPILMREREWWLAPARGLLGGTVESAGPDAFTLEAFDGVVWDVDGTDLSALDRATVAAGGVVRVVGIASTTAPAFHACFVFPWDADERRIIVVQSGTSSRTEKEIAPAARSEVCKGLGPYEKLRAYDGDR